MKKLKIYKENGDFVIERINEFNHAFKRHFITEQGLLEGLQSYQPVMEQYELDVSKELSALITTFLSSWDLHE